MSKLVYSVHVEPMRKGGFYITVPALLGCHGTAKTFDSALIKAKTMIEEHLKVLSRQAKFIPIERQDMGPLCLPIRVNIPKGAKTILAWELAG